MPVDYSTNVGKVRMRIGDVSDLPFLQDEVIDSVLSENSQNLQASAQTCAQYILAQLSFKSHKKMVQLEIWGGDAFAQYRQFLLDTISNPALMSFTALPVVVTGDNTAIDPLKQFTEDWNTCWSRPETVTDMVHRVAGNPSKHPWDNV
jgi:hypothetical protein